MRATLRASSSMSTAPRLSGSDGALTETPQSCVARHGLLDFRWTLLVTAARRIIGAAFAVVRRMEARRGGQPGSGSATLLWSYCRFKTPDNYLNWQQFYWSKGRVGGRRASAAMRWKWRPPHLNANVAFIAGLARAHDGGSTAATGRDDSRRLLGLHHRRPYADRGRRASGKRPATAGRRAGLSGGARHAAGA